jgi:hypothetical protein
MAVLEREMQDGTGITLSEYDVLLRLAEAPSYAVLTDDGMERLRAASAVHLVGVRRHFAAQFADDEAGVVAAFLDRLHESTLTCEPPSRALVTITRADHTRRHGDRSG